jgi:predicted secreted protein
MEHDQYTGKSDAMTPHGDDSPRTGTDCPPATERPGVSRRVLWTVLAGALVGGLVLYFRFEKVIVALFDRGH